MNPKELIFENFIEKRDRIIATKLGLTFEELALTIFEPDDDDNMAFCKIIFNQEESPVEILNKIDGLQDGYWIVIESISMSDQ